MLILHSTKIAGSSILSSLQQDLPSLLQLPSLWTKVAMWRNYRENLWISRYFLCALFFFGWSLVYFTTITRTTITMGRKPFWSHFLSILNCFDMVWSIPNSEPLWNIWSNQNVSSKSYRKKGMSTMGWNQSILSSFKFCQNKKLCLKNKNSRIVLILRKIKSLNLWEFYFWCKWTKFY